MTDSPLLVSIDNVAAAVLGYATWALGGVGRVLLSGSDPGLFSKETGAAG